MLTKEQQVLIHAHSVTSGCIEDLEGMKRHHPVSKRGSNYTRYLESLEFRLRSMREELAELTEGGAVGDERTGCADDDTPWTAEQYSAALDEITEGTWRLETPMPTDPIEIAPSIPIPAGGFATNNQEADWLAETIALRVSETLLRHIGVSANLNTTSLRELLLLSLESASKRGAKRTLRQAQTMRAALEQILKASKGIHARPDRAWLHTLARAALSPPVESAEA